MTTNNTENKIGKALESDELNSLQNTSEELFMNVVFRSGNRFEYIVNADGEVSVNSNCTREEMLMYCEDIFGPVWDSHGGFNRADSYMTSGPYPTDIDGYYDGVLLVGCAMFDKLTAYIPELSTVVGVKLSIVLDKFELVKQIALELKNRYSNQDNTNITNQVIEQPVWLLPSCSGTGKHLSFTISESDGIVLFRLTQRPFAFGGYTPQQPRFDQQTNFTSFQPQSSQGFFNTFNNQPPHQPPHQPPTITRHHLVLARDILVALL